MRHTMDYFTCLQFSGLNWRLYTRPVMAHRMDDAQNELPIWKCCLSNYQHQIKLEAPIVASENTIQDLKQYFSNIFNHGNRLIYEFYSREMQSLEHFSPLSVERLTIALPESDFKLQFQRVEFNERDEASIEGMIHLLKENRVKSEEIRQLKQRVEQLEQQSGELKQLFIEWKLFKERRQVKQRLASMVLAPLVNVLRENSVIVSDNSDYMMRLVKWMKKVGYKPHVRLYRASTDGWRSFNFHACCDNRGATLVIVKATNGRIRWFHCQSVAIE